MIKKIHIYDMDGTIVCSLHRFRTLDNGKIDLQYWIDNCTPEKIAQDSLLPLAEQYKSDLADPNTYVVIATARVLEDADMAFIRNRLGEPNYIISRQGRKDSRRGADMKTAGIKRLLNLRQFRNAEIHFWEDNPDYLSGVCAATGAVPHFVPSAQGV